MHIVLQPLAVTAVAVRNHVVYFVADAAGEPLVCALLTVWSWWSEAVATASFWRSISLYMCANRCGDVVVP